MKVLVAVIVGLVAALGMMSASTGSSQAITPGEAPNIIFVLTDDQDVTTLEYMPNLQQVLVDRGKTFGNTVSTYPWCCPARASILRGQYAHNTGIVGNGTRNGGGWQTFREKGYHLNNVFTWADGAGYRTSYFGKIMNHYDGTGVVEGKGTLPGLDRQHIWSGMEGASSPYKGFETADAFVANKALGEVRENINGGPLYMTVAFWASHAPYPSESKYDGMFTAERVPRDPNYNVKPDEDDPPWIRRLGSLTVEEQQDLDTRHRDRLRALQTVDAFLADLYDALGNEAANTYVIFYTDNGFHLGDHRLPQGKLTAYEEDTGFPLIVRGPGVAEGKTDERLVGGHDIAPTIADISGADAPGFVDGRSVRPLLEAQRGEVVPWRSAVLSERIVQGKQPTYVTDGPGYPGWRMVRTESRAYIRYDSGFKEMYNLDTDPYQLNNQAVSPGIASRKVLDRLRARLAALKSCAGESCRTAENGP